MGWPHPPAAVADHHLIKITEVYAGSFNAEFVELQMYSAGQGNLDPGAH